MKVEKRKGEKDGRTKEKARKKKRRKKISYNSDSDDSYQSSRDRNYNVRLNCQIGFFFL